VEYTKHTHGVDGNTLVWMK